MDSMSSISCFSYHSGLILNYLHVITPLNESACVSYLPRVDGWETPSTTLTVTYDLCPWKIGLIFKYCIFDLELCDLDLVPYDHIFG